MARDCAELILLVGSNPLPNYLSARTLGARTALLVYSDATERPQRQLATALAEAGARSLPRWVGDPHGAEAVRAVVASALREYPDAYLDYTGGTKVMAAHARLAFAEAGGKPERASYLVEDTGQLRFDAGPAADVAPIGLHIRQLAALHGVTVGGKGVKDQPPSGGPTVGHAELLAWKVLDRPELAGELYQAVQAYKQETAQAKVEGRDAEPLDLTAVIDPFPCGQLPQRVPEVGWNAKQTRRWLELLQGEWLEIWTQQQVRKTVPDWPAWHDVNGTLASGRPYQVDVATIGRFRSYTASCTTEREVALAKLKAFEVSLRARQLGGDLARWALVCLLDSMGVVQVEGDVAAAWGSPALPEVFGLEHLREWRDGQLGTLRNWLQEP